jgi:hypothetical protein
MKNLITISLLASLVFSQDMWINEIHYDNYGTDEGEFIELAVASSFTNLSAVTVSLYNGNNSQTYNTVTLDAFTAGGNDVGFTFYYYDFPSNGIQNGGSDGISLDNGGQLIQFLSYEGTLTASDGAAIGQTSVDIGTSEPGEVGESLQLQGIGTTYASFSWFGPILSTKGSVNTNQILGDTGTIYGCTDPSAVNYNEVATDDDGSCEYAIDKTIYEIQYTDQAGEGTYDCYPSPYGTFGNEQYVTTTGVVTAVKSDNPNFYIQDISTNTYAGIYVYDNTWSPVLGNEITITGKVEEYYGFTEVTTLSSYTVNSSGNTVAIKDITTGDLANGCTATGESLEGMLVRISNVNVTQEVNDYGEWYVDDGTGVCQIDDSMFDGEWLNPSSGQQFDSIIGVVDYAYSIFGILPRTMSDITMDATQPVANAGMDQAVVPGSYVTLDGTASYDPNGSIIAYEWTQLSGTAVTLSDEEAAITTFTSPNSNGSLTFKLSVFDNDFNEDTDEIVITISSPITIQDIQYTTVQGEYCYETSMAGETVTTSGVVTAVKPGEYPNFFLTQPGANSWGGIYVYDTSVSPQVGDELVLSATVNEYYSFTQLIDVTTSLTVSNGNSVNPISISTGDLGIACSFEGEGYESMLVKVSNITVEGVDEFGNWTINDGSGQTMVDDYFFDGDWPSVSIGDDYGSITGVVEYSYSEFKILPRNADDISEEGGCILGDLNGDGGWNVLDIVTLANCILAENCADLEYGCAGDLNQDGGWNVLDIVTLANCVLADNCGGRIDDASSASLIINENHLSIEGDGFIGGVQITLTHGSDFSIEMTDRALFADYLTTGNTTRLLVITPETEKLFSFKGEFEITELIVANSQNEIPTSMPTIFSISSAYPNPFNPVTTLTLTIPEAGDINVQVYNLYGQIVSTLLSGHNPANTYSLVWDASNIPSGMYFVRAEVGGFSETQKLMLIK